MRQNQAFLTTVQMYVNPKMAVLKNQVFHHSIGKQNKCSLGDRIFQKVKNSYETIFFSITTYDPKGSRKPNFTKKIYR